MRRVIALTATFGTLALLLTGCGTSLEQQREQAALAFAQTVNEKTPDAVCDGYAGHAIVDPQGWEDIEIDTVAIEPTNAGEYIIGLRYTKKGEEKLARAWVASAGDAGYCVRIAADGGLDHE
jgi:hypothetical protein